MKNYCFLALAFIVSLAPLGGGCARPLVPPAMAGMGGYGAYGAGGYGYMPGMTGAVMPYGGSVYTGTSYDIRTHGSVAAYDQARLAARSAVAPCISCSGAAPVVAPPPVAASPSGDATTRAIVRQVIDMEERLEDLEAAPTTTH